ncbi:hypothetical protein MAPG_09753 [Magnaporthiopsis poae ATCC 64411]|uniref:Uncharacterized protein n=1 Tax=Magnaporthiopsis poae (strain ATCC 64411 / 73-15) TaxID=644358 RepID=A0A0C4EAS4_MAGP6|nr:hypothetical protein MAPG_09753 [Magnaporthiopsis poae ATCC 64411]
MGHLSSSLSSVSFICAIHSILDKAITVQTKVTRYSHYLPASMGNMENSVADSGTLLDPETATPRPHGPSTRSSGLRAWLATRVSICVVCLLFITGMSLLVGYVIMSAASAMVKRGVTPTTPSVLIHGYPVPIVTTNHTGNHTSIIQVRNIKMQDDEAVEVEQLDATTDLELEAETVAGTKAAAAAAELPTMASLTVVEVYEPQTKTATISYWPDLVEPTSVVLQTSEPSSSSSSFTIKLRPGTGNMQPWWHRPQITRNAPKPKATASTTGPQKFGAKQTTTANPTSSTTVTSFTAMTQSAEAKVSAAANRQHQTTLVFYSVSRPVQGHGRDRHTVTKLPTVVPTVKNVTDGSVAIPASAAADRSSLDESAAAESKNENTTTSSHDSNDGDHHHVSGRPAMVLANGTVFVHPPRRPADITAAVFKQHLGPAAAARLNVSAEGLAVNGTRILWANGTASAAARAAQMSGELTA